MAHPRWRPLFGAAARGGSTDIGGPARGGQQGRRKALGNTLGSTSLELVETGVTPVAIVPLDEE